MGGVREFYGFGFDCFNSQFKIHGLIEKVLDLELPGLLAILFVRVIGEDDTDRSLEWVGICKRGFNDFKAVALGQLDINNYQIELLLL